MTQRSNVAKKIIKNTLAGIRVELPKLRDAESRIATRLCKSPNDERVLEQEARIKTQRAIAQSTIEQLEELLEGDSIRLVSKEGNRAVIRVDGVEHNFSIVPAKILTIARGLTNP